MSDLVVLAFDTETGAAELPGEIAFDQDDNLVIQDHTWYKVWVINLDIDPEWLEHFPKIHLPLVSRGY